MLSVLLGSVGVAFSEKLCQMAGVRSAEVTAQQGACCGKPAQPSDTDSCCQEHVSYQKLEPVSTLKQYNLPSPAFVQAAPAPAAPALPANRLYQQPVYTYTDSSPPLYGRQLLHFLHTLIV